MHRELKDLLPRARGESHLVVVVFMDVRGFTTFAKIAESAEAALFLRSIYVRILDRHFPEAAFFKPTGDGLLIILDYDDDNLPEVLNSAVSSSLKLIRGFPQLTSDDPMVNFPTPDSLGIGITRGAATALVSGGKVLDYSGRPLNFAARLMDLARPRGVVLSGTMGMDLLKSDVADEFAEEKAYVKSIAEDEPITIHVMKDSVQLSEATKRPINRYEWKMTEQEEFSFARLQSERPIGFLHHLPVEPALPEDVRIHVSHRAKMSNGRQNSRQRIVRTYKGDYFVRMGDHLVRLQYAPIISELKKYGVKSTWPVKIVIEYAVHASDY